MMNKVWIFLVICGLSISFFTGNIKDMGAIIINSTQKAFDVFLNISLMIVFWNGIFEIAIKSDIIHYIGILLKKPLCFIMPSLKKDSESLELISANILANFLGLGSAATPLGIKAMESLQKKNLGQRSSRSMIIFVLLNASAPTLFPTTIIGLRTLNNASTSINLFVLMIFLSLLSCTIGILLEKIFYHLVKEKPL